MHSGITSACTGQSNGGAAACRCPAGDAARWASRYAAISARTGWFEREGKLAGCLIVVFWASLVHSSHTECSP